MLLISVYSYFHPLRVLINNKKCFQKYLKKESLQDNVLQTFNLEIKKKKLRKLL